MGERSRTARLVAVVLLLALSARLLPFLWTPLPATLDGFAYADVARHVGATGALPLDGYRADHFVFPLLLAVAAAVFDLDPLSVIQPLTAPVGAAAVLSAVVVYRRGVAELGWPAPAAHVAVGAGGTALAASGVFLQRTYVPDTDAVVFVLLPLLLLAFHRAVRTRRPAWLAVTAAWLVAFPLLHTMSSLVAALAVTCVLALAARPSPRGALVGVATAGAFWAYVGGYYRLAGASDALVVPYTSRVLDAPGLFLAWGIVAVAGVAWFRRAGATTRRIAVGGVFALWFGVLAANRVVTVFPGTVSTPPRVLLFALPLAVPAALAAHGVGALALDREGGAVLASLLAAPCAVVFFSLTAALSPDYFMTVVRVQVFAHVPVFGAAAVGAAAYLRRDGPAVARPTARLPAGSLGRFLAAALVASALLTTPLAAMEHDTGDAPYGTLESEFAAVTHAAGHVPGGWTTDDSLQRIDGHLYGTPVRMSPAAAWLREGRPPACPVLSQRSWTTTGAHFYPAAPETIAASRYDRRLAARNVVYRASGLDPPTLSLPRSRPPDGRCSRG